MMLLRWIVNALLLLIAAAIVPGFAISGLYAALIAALVLGLLNASLRWVLVVLTLPVNILTLGLFGFVINALMLWLMTTVVKGTELVGFWPAVLVAIVLWLGGWVTNLVIKSAKEHEVRQ